MEAVEYLLEAGSKLNDREAEEGLCVAAQQMRVAVVELLMRKRVAGAGKALEIAMALPPEFLPVLGTLLESRPTISSGVIFDAINADSHVGLERILSSGKGTMAVAGNGLCLIKSDFAISMRL